MVGKHVSQIGEKKGTPSKAQRRASAQVEKLSEVPVVGKVKGQEYPKKEVNSKPKRKVKPKPGQPTREEATKKFTDLYISQEPLTYDNVDEIVDTLNSMTIKDIHSLKKSLGFKGGGPTKRALSIKIATRMVNHVNRVKGFEMLGEKQGEEKPQRPQHSKSIRTQQSGLTPRAPSVVEGRFSIENHDCCKKFVMGLLLELQEAKALGKLDRGQCKKMIGAVKELAKRPKELMKFTSEKEHRGLMLSMNISLAHAPSGGITIAGKFYEGGQFIPGEAMEHATPDDIHMIEWVGNYEEGRTHEGVPIDQAPSLNKEQILETLKWLGKLSVSPQDNVPNKDLPDETRPELTPHETGALQKYSSRHYRVLNGLLRGDEDALKLKGMHYSREFYTEMQAQMDSAFEKAKPMKTPMIVTRGSNISDPERYKKFMEQAKPGAEITLEGYTSTARPGGIDGFLARLGFGDGVKKNFRGNVNFQIKARKGLDVKPYSQLPSEEEFLLPNNSRFRIDKVVKGKKGSVTVYMEQIV